MSPLFLHARQGESGSEYSEDWPGRFQEATRQERGQPCPRELDLKPGTRGHGCPRSNLQSALRIGSRCRQRLDVTGFCGYISATQLVMPRFYDFLPDALAEG